MLLSLYIDGASPLHRCPAGGKLTLLACTGIGIFLVSDPAWLAALLVVCLGLIGVARLPLGVVVRAVLPFAVLIGVFFGLHALLSSLETAIVIALRFGVMVLLGLLLAMTTRLSALVAALETGLAPLRLVGVRPERAGLVLSMTIRFIPLVAATYRDIAAAQKARGLERNVLALMVPMLVKLLRRADAVGDALTARGLDD